MHEHVLEKIEEIVSPIVAEEGVELYDITLTGAPGRNIIRITLDSKTGSVSVDDCARVSHAVEDILEVKQVVPFSYYLEVSTPGLDRRLRKKEHFEKSAGQKIFVSTFGPIEGQRNFRGILEQVTDEGLLLTLDQKKIQIPFKEIAKSHREVQL